MDKKAVVAALRRSLEEELERFTSRAKDAAEAATHEENKPEGDKDMRSTEASYIAKGQADRAMEIEGALSKLSSMELLDFGPEDTIAVSALVDVMPGKTTYFLVPVAGGAKLDVEGESILTLAITSPLGAALVSLQQGEDAEVQTPQGMRTYKIRRVR